MQTFRKYFISLVLLYKVRKKTSLIRCTANQFSTGHKRHFQPNHPAWAKLALINIKNGCGTAKLQCRHFGSVSYHWNWHLRSVKRQLWSSAPPTKPAQAISFIFNSNIQLGPNWQQSTTKWLWHGRGGMDIVRKCFISLLLIYKIMNNTALISCTANQVNTTHKLHFQPKHPVRAKWTAINNKNSCDTAEVWWRHFGSVSYHWY